MFILGEVQKVMDELKTKYFCFASEAHLQMAFIIEATKKYKKQFEFIPEFPMFYNGIRSEYDLLVLDKNNGDKTLIEFKYKTANRSNPVEFPLYDYKKIGINQSIELAKQAAQNDARFACWNDIARIENAKKNNKINNGFFVFVTNDPLYWETDGSVQEMSIIHNGLLPNVNKNKGAYNINYNSTTLQVFNQYKFEYKNYYTHQLNITHKGNQKEIEEFKQLIISI